MDKVFVFMILIIVILIGLVLTYQINPLNPATRFCQEQGHDALTYEIDNWVVCKNFVESCKGNYCKTTEEFFEYVF